MLATAIGLAMMLGTEVDPCDAWLAADALTVECEAADYGALSFGDVTAKGFDIKVADDDNGDGIGYLSYQLGPKPAEGYYRYGVTPACIRDGVLTNSGLGQAWEQPGYRTHSKDETSAVLSYIDDPCYTPGERVAVFFGGYSDDEVVDPYAYKPGWDDGDYRMFIQFRTTCPGYKAIKSANFAATVTSEPAYGAKSGTAKLNFLLTDIEYCNPTSPDRADALFNVAMMKADGTSSSTKTCFINTAVVTFSCETFAATSTLPYVGVRAGDWLSGGEDIIWRPVGSPDRDGGDAQLGWSGRAMVIRDDALNDLVFNPLRASMDYAENQCTTLECVTSYCDDVADLDLIGYVKCLFAMDVDLIDYVDTMRGNFDKFEAGAMIGHGVDMLLAWPRAAASLDGQCGVMFDLDGTVLEGVTGNTCTWPLQVEIRFVLSALVLVSFVTAIVGMLHRFMTTGHIRPLGDGDLNNGDGI